MGGLGCSHPLTKLLLINPAQCPTIKIDDLIYKVIALAVNLNSIKKIFLRESTGTPSP